MSKGLIVQKFGGTSVKDIKRIQNVAKRVINYKSKGYDIVVVVSALGNTTDRLITMAQEITSMPAEREVDMLISTGEQVSAALLAIAIEKLGYQAISFTGAQVGIITDRYHTKARILKIQPRRISEELRKKKVVIVAGFQGITFRKDITTLGRGGSDLTAVALANTLGASVCEIYTDVDGVYTTDPRIEPKARKLDFITHDEMLEMASLGAQVMQARSILFAKRFNVDIHVRSSFNQREGTIISKEAKMLEDVFISGVTLNANEAKITICDVPDRPGIAAKIFKRLANEDISVDTIVQNVSRTGQTDVSFTVRKPELKKALKLTRASARSIRAGGVIKDEDIARVSIVGVGMKSHSGVAAKMFEALADRKINIEMITTSEISISCIIKKRLGKEAVRVLHRKFGLEKRK